MNTTGCSRPCPRSDFLFLFKNIIAFFTYNVSTAEIQCGYRVHHLLRGKMLGCSSGINFMAYVRPSAEDIDSWADHSPGWSWNTLRPYFPKSESLLPDNSPPQPARIFQPRLTIPRASRAGATLVATFDARYRTSCNEGSP